MAITAPIIQFETMSRFMDDAGCSTAVVMPGVVSANLTDKQMTENLKAALYRVLPLAESRGYTLLIEPLNTTIDHSGYFLGTSEPVFELVAGYGSPHLKALHDIYHMQIMEGNIVDRITANLPDIGHIHVAGVPGRAEPDRGELNYENIIKQVATASYPGFFGFEYFPSYDDTTSLSDHQRYVTF